MKSWVSFAIMVTGLVLPAQGHTEMHFTLMEVQRTIKASTSTLQLDYDCKLISDIPETVLPMVDINMNGDLETSETELLWSNAAEYLEEDLIVYAGREQVADTKVRYAPSADNKSCIFHAVVPLPKSDDDLALTIIDPVFLVPFINGPEELAPTQCRTIPPLVFVVDGDTTNTVEIETSPAGVLVVRKASSQ